jgi:hypothetical protein
MEKLTASLTLFLLVQVQQQNPLGSGAQGVLRAHSGRAQAQESGPCRLHG